MKIEFIGAQGTGKSTILNHFQSEFVIIDNVIRNLVRDEGIHINQQGDEQSQDAIFRAFLRVLDEYQDYMCERSLIDVLAFSQYLYIHGKIEYPDLIIEQSNQIKQYLREHDDVVFVYFPVEFAPVDDGLRSTDKQYQHDIDKIIQKILTNLKVPYYTIHGTVEDRVDFMNNLIDHIEVGGVKKHLIKGFN